MSKSEASKNAIDRIIDEFGINANYVIELFQRFQQQPSSIDEEWRAFFTELIDVPSKVAAAAREPAADSAGRVALAGPALRLAENMERSLGVPTATSQRQVAVKLLEENRLLLNAHLARAGRKVSFTHIIARAVVVALRRFPQLNDTFTQADGSAYRVRHDSVNLGIAVDIERKDGTRSLLVPNIKTADRLDFARFLDSYDETVRQARAGKLPVDAYQGTTVTITNPGTIGTTASNPRLMAGQGLIIATGAIGYPPEYQAMSAAALARLGVGKIMTITSTYDHRVIQGAESGHLLAFIDELLRGEHNFYNDMFAELNIPQRAYQWATDRNPDVLGAGSLPAEISKQARVLELINAYRVRGHLVADLDPLGWRRSSYHPELDISSYGFTIWDLDREFFTGGLNGRERATLREIVASLRRWYCGTHAIEYRHIQSPEEKEWLRARIETDQPAVPVAVKKQMLWKLISAEQFEAFLGTRYLGQKRFSVEGAEVFVALLDQLIDGAAARGIDDITIGMSHRGRLNVIANVIGRFCERIFTSFEGSVHPDFPHDAGDVKYHQGASGTRETEGGRVQIAVLPNPSHLEFIDPVVEGVVRAKQDGAAPNVDDSAARYQKLAVLAHGDAAFAGEGIVAETLNLSQLAGYRTGGTIHIIVNNQLGFTTLPEEGRSSTYSTDVAKMVQAPIFHINGDDPEAAYHALQIALDYRQRYHKDIVIDLIGYRRHGHNEGDEPTYTQPVMYRLIRAHTGVRDIYARKLVREGVIDEAEAQFLIEERLRRYENAQLGAQEIVARQQERRPNIDTTVEPEPDTSLATGVDGGLLRDIGARITTVPSGFNLNPKAVGLLARRARMAAGEVPVDWGMAEALAFGSLLKEGRSVRISGQDTDRGTFSQRHAVLYNNNTGEPWTPLKALAGATTIFEVYDSPLSEAGVLGFEYGYSVTAADALVLWEAQFGDFVNAAQVIVDQFIAAGEQKWHQSCRLVLLLPHGYEGQGPEHSSARVERFLQLCAGGNMQVANCTTAAQYFHLLRRQAHQPARKPLVVMTPKSLLRSAHASSPITDFTAGGFRPVLADSGLTTGAKRVLVCSGKIYYELLEERKKRNQQGIAIVRLEQLYPFPATELTKVLGAYEQAEICWVQEEPRNMGGYDFVAPRLQPLVAGRALRYIGRDACPSSATGFYVVHQLEQRRIIETALAD